MVKLHSVNYKTNYRGIKRLANSKYIQYYIGTLDVAVAPWRQPARDEMKHADWVAKKCMSKIQEPLQTLMRKTCMDPSATFSFLPCNQK
ncbi:unnamed protein product [Urochloa humidicola]